MTAHPRLVDTDGDARTGAPGAGGTPPTAFVPSAMAPVALEDSTWRRGLTDHLRRRGLDVLRGLAHSEIVEILEQATQSAHSTHADLIA